MARLIDSSVFIQLERIRLDLGALPTIMPEAEKIALSAITVLELMVGLRCSASEAQRLRKEAFLDGILETIPVIPFGPREALTEGRLQVELANRGQRFGPHDVLIAATALTHGYGVLTDNVAAFRKVPGLSVEAPDWPEADSKA